MQWQHSVSKYKKISFEAFEGKLLWPITNSQKYNKYSHTLTHTHTHTLFNNKKIHYHKEHSASAVLSWRTVRHFWSESVDGYWLINHCYIIGLKATKFGEITQNKSHNIVQGHSRSPILVPIESPFATSYYWIILTFILSCTISKLWPNIVQIFASDRGGRFTLTPSWG